MNLIEGWGTGIPRLLREMKEYGLAEPEFVDMEIALRINLYRTVDAAKSSPVQKSALEMQGNKEVHLKCAKSALKRALNAQEKAIIEYIEKHGSITSVQLMDLLEVKKRRSQVILSRMVRDKLICKRGASRSTVYVLVDENDQPNSE